VAARASSGSAARAAGVRARSTPGAGGGARGGGGARTGSGGGRRDAIREILARGTVATQDDLQRQLAARGALPLDPVRVLVDSVRTNGTLVVVRTKASAASTVARAIDDAGLPDVLGSLAGDDTVFIAPARSRAAPALARRLRRLFGV